MLYVGGNRLVNVVDDEAVQELKEEIDEIKADIATVKEDVESANSTTEEVLAKKVDKLENTSGTEVVYTQKTNNEVILRPVADSPAPTTIPRRTGTGAVRTATPTEDDHAVNLKYLTDNYGTHEERITTLEAWWDFKSDYTTYESDADGMIQVPTGAFRYAKIMELQCSKCTNVTNDPYENYIGNYPKQIVTDTGEVLFEIPSDVEAKLAHFGAIGNYIYFEDGKAYYKQTTRYDDYYNYELQEGESWYDSTCDSSVIIKLAEPIVTDISDYITFDGIIDTEGCTAITVVPRYTEDDISSAHLEEAELSYWFSMPKIKLAFEVEG